MNVITIDAERCTGCSACVEVCPTGALYLVDGKATVDNVLCRECEACLAACPCEAISLVTQEGPIAETAPLPALRPEPAVIRVKTQPTLVPFRSKVLTAVGAALAWAGREILPSLEEFLLDTLDHHTTRAQERGAARSQEALASTAKGGGRQHRHRQRGSR
jgi:Fe-S-cluster-containing hydrogenase component 2